MELPRLEEPKARPEMEMLEVEPRWRLLSVTLLLLLESLHRLARRCRYTQPMLCY